jgi:hypothetical protein
MKSSWKVMGKSDSDSGSHGLILGRNHETHKTTEQPSKNSSKAAVPAYKVLWYDQIEDYFNAWICGWMMPSLDRTFSFAASKQASPARLASAAATTPQQSL